jgi:hypothetical protein
MRAAGNDRADLLAKINASNERLATEQQHTMMLTQRILEQNKVIENLNYNNYEKARKN